MAIIQLPTAPFKVDVDEFILRDAIDANLSDYLKFLVTDAAGYVTLQAKAGDIRLQDPDDSDSSDTIQFTMDDADGSILQKTSQITDGNIWEIRATGTISGAAATVDIDYIHLDLDALVLNDAATSAITLQGIDIDYNGLTATAVTLSSLTGTNIEMPSTGAFATEVGLNIITDKGDAAQGAKSIVTSRDLTAAITADRAITNYAIDISQAVTNTSAGDFDVSDAAASGLMKLTLAHTANTSVGAKTDADICRGTAILVDIDGTTSEANTKLDFYPRAVDIAYTFTETAGTLQAAATDIMRISLTKPTGIGSAGVHQLDVFEINLDGVTLNDANETLNAIYIDASDLTNTASAAINLLNLVGPDDSNLTNLVNITADVGDSALSQTALRISRDLNATITADRAVTGFTSYINQDNQNTSAGDFDLSDAADSGVIKIGFSHSAVTTVGAKTDPDVFQGTALALDIDALTNNANTKLDAYPRAIDINYTLTESAGTLRWATTDIMRIDFNTSGTLSSAAAAAINMLLLDADGVTINDSNVSMDGLKVDMSALTLTDASSLHGVEITIPTLVGQASTRFGLYATDGTVTAKMVDGSMGVSATGINDEKYYRCEDFDEEAAAVTLDAGLRGDEWTFGGTNGDAGDVTYIQSAGGAIRMETDGADDDSVYALWLNTAVYTGANPIIEFRIQVNSVTANILGMAVGLAETGTFTTMSFDAVDDDYILMTINSDTANPANLKLVTEDNNGGITTADLGVAMTANVWCTIRIDCTDTEQPRIFVNNTGGAITPSHEIAAATVGAGTIQDNIYMYPVLFVQCLDATPSAQHIEIDYIRIWQDRS